MTKRAIWDDAYNVGHALLDQQHRALLEQCNALAACVDAAATAGHSGEQEFRVLFGELVTMAREHFAAEASWLVGLDAALEDQEELEGERTEFEYLADDIITTENFETAEIQRFLVLWWVGHIVGLAKKANRQ